MHTQAPPTRYASSGEGKIAYQVVGHGPVDLVFVGGPASHLDMLWEEPDTVRGIERLAAYTRLVLFDRRGTGLSDPVEHPPTYEQQMDDLCAVMDDVGLECAAVMGAVDAGLCAMFAATHPSRVNALVLSNISPTRALTEERSEEILEIIENHWGEGRLLALYVPGRVGDHRFEEWWARYERAAVSPSMARKLLDMQLQTELRGLLPSIRVPTLVLHSVGNPLIPVELGREAAALIPGARFVEVPGPNLYSWAEPPGPADDAVEEFLTGGRRPREPDRVLATVLFTDIVGSTDRAAELGDRAWRELLDRHNTLVREELERWRGGEVKTVGDGFLATFDGPARGVRCASAIIEGVRDLGLAVRAGLHTGECERLNGDVGGIAVHIGARIMTLAGEGEVLVSSTVKDLVVGSGLRFSDRGAQDLRGVPGEWRLYALEP